MMTEHEPLTAASLTAIEQRTLYVGVAQVDDVVCLLAEVRRLRAALQTAKLPHRADLNDTFYHCELVQRPDDDLAECGCGPAEHNAAIDAALGDEVPS